MSSGTAVLYQEGESANVHLEEGETLNGSDSVVNI